MKTQIENVQQYFIKMLLEGNFQIVKVHPHTCKLRIDNLYDFTIWTSNQPINRKQSKEFEVNFMTIDISDEQAILLDSTLRPMLKHYDENVQRIEDIKELERLAKKLNSNPTVI